MLRWRKGIEQKTDTTIEDAKNFNSETHKMYFITMMNDTYEIDLITWEEYLLQIIPMIKNSVAIKDASCRMLQSQIQLRHEEYD